MLKKAVGIVIRRVAYGDNHLIITFLNEAGVKVALMAGMPVNQQSMVRD